MSEEREVIQGKTRRLTAFLQQVYKAISCCEALVRIWKRTTRHAGSMPVVLVLQPSPYPF